MYRKTKFIYQGTIVLITIFLFMIALGCGLSEEPEEVLSEEKQTGTSYFEEVFVCGYQDTFQKIKLLPVETGIYYVFMPGEMRTDVFVEFDQFEQLQIGDVVYQTGDELTDIYKSESYTMLAKDSQGNVLEEAAIHFYFSVFVPSIYVESESGTMDLINEEKGYKGKAGFTVIDESGTINATGQCNIKSRGNTSFQSEQKSYSLNLAEEQSVLGMSSCSEWTLLANYSNSVQQMKNKIALDLAKLLGMEFSPESRFVNVYLDHQYYGLYLMTQKVSADGGSVRTDNFEKNDSCTDDFYLMEFDARYKEEPVWFETGTKKVVLKYPQNADAEQKAYISSYMQEAETALFSEGEWERYLDPESWMTMYLLQEFFVQWDVEFSSFFVYKKPEDPLIYAGPVWDFDLTCGATAARYDPQLAKKTLLIKDNRDGWLRRFGMIEKNHLELKKKYQKEFVPVFEQYLKEKYAATAEQISSSAYMNAKRWNRGDVDLMADAADLFGWLTERKEFLNQYLEENSEFRQITFQFSWGPMSYYVKRGETLGFLPCGERDLIVGWKTGLGDCVTEELIVEEDMILQPIYAQ